MRAVKKGKDDGKSSADDFFESPDEYDLSNNKFKVSSTVKNISKNLTYIIFRKVIAKVYLL